MNVGFGQSPFVACPSGPRIVGGRLPEIDTVGSLIDLTTGTAGVDMYGVHGGHHRSTPARRHSCARKSTRTRAFFAPRSHTDRGRCGRFSFARSSGQVCCRARRLVAVWPDPPASRHRAELGVGQTGSGTSQPITAADEDWIRVAIDERRMERHPEPPRSTMKIELRAIFRLRTTQAATRCNGAYCIVLDGRTRHVP